MSHQNSNNALNQGKVLEKDHESFLDQMKQGSNNIMVVVRTRPLNTKEQAKSMYETVKVLDERVAVLLDPGFELNPDDVLRKNRNKEMQFAFDFVYDKTIGQEHIYKTSVSFLIDGVFEGFNGTVFAYGATGAGKTYTMIGNADSPGIMERSMNDVFRNNEQQRLTKDISIKASYIEIYNETIKDLLTTSSKHLELREDPSQGVIVSGITEIAVASTSEILHLLKVGNKNRTIESTGANEVSSRSHAVLQVMLQIKDRASGVQSEIQYSKLSLVDLAGSERASSTNNRGIRLIEGAKINQSLLVLGNCIQALSEASEKNLKNHFVQYRGSKLTRMLKDSLGGNCRTVMIANVSPHLASFEDTYNTLNFANRAKTIKTNVTRNYLSVDNHISNYTNLIDALKKENENLKRLLRNQSSPDAREKMAHIREDDDSNGNNGGQSVMESVDLKDHQSNYKQQHRNQSDRHNNYVSPARNRKPSIYSTVDPHGDQVQSQDALHYDVQYLNSNNKQRNNSNSDANNNNNYVRGSQGAAANRYNLAKDQSANVGGISNGNMKEKSANNINNSNNKLQQGAISTAKERQINYLKNQLRLRDDIIKDQKSILDAQYIPYEDSNNELFDQQISSLQQLGSGPAMSAEHSNSLNTDYDYPHYQSSIIPSEPNLPSVDSGVASHEVRPFEKVKVRAKSKIEMSKNISPSAAAAAGKSESDQEASEPFRLPRIGFTSPTKKQINNSLKVNNYKYGNILTSHQQDSKGNSYGFGSGGGGGSGAAGINISESGKKKEHSGSRLFIHNQQSQQLSSHNKSHNHSHHQYHLERSFSNKRVDTNENPTVAKFDSRMKSPSSKRELSENQYVSIAGQSPVAASGVNASIDLDRKRRQQKRTAVYSSNIIDSNRYQAQLHHFEGAASSGNKHSQPSQQHPQPRPSSIIGNSGSNSLSNNNAAGQVLNTNSNEVEKSFRTSSSSVFSNKSHSKRPRNNHKDLRIQMYLNKEFAAGNQQHSQSVNSDVLDHHFSNPQQSNQASAFQSEKKDPSAQQRVRTPRAAAAGVSDNHNHNASTSNTNPNNISNNRSKDQNSRVQLYQQNQHLVSSNWGSNNQNDANASDENPIWTPSSNQKLKAKQFGGGQQQNRNITDSNDFNIIMHERNKLQQQQQSQHSYQQSQQQQQHPQNYHHHNHLESNSNNERKGMTAVATAAQILAPSPQHMNQIRKPNAAAAAYLSTPGVAGSGSTAIRDSSEDHRFQKIRQSQDEGRSSMNLRGGGDEQQNHRGSEGKHDRLKFLNNNLKNLKHQDIKVQHSIDATTTTAPSSSSNNHNNYNRNIFQQENLPLHQLSSQQLNHNHHHPHYNKKIDNNNSNNGGAAVNNSILESRDRINSIARRHYPQSSQQQQNPPSITTTSTTPATHNVANVNQLVGAKRNFSEQRSERSISALHAPSSRLGLLSKN